MPEVRLKLLDLPPGEVDAIVDVLEPLFYNFLNAYDAVAFQLDDGNKPTKADLAALKKAVENLDKQLEVFRKETGV